MNNTMKRLSRGAAVALLCTNMAQPLIAEESAMDPEAVQRLQASLEYLGGLRTFSMETDTTIEVVLENGQKLQFDNLVEATVQRPNKFHAERLGELADQEFFYDGKTLTLHDGIAGFYATLEAPPTLEGMLEFARDSLDIVAPAGDFLYGNAFQLLMDGVTSALHIGPAFIEGTVCDHLAFRNPASEMDFQVWVEQGDTPLLRRIVMTSTDLPGAPQFAVHFREWDLAPEVDAEDFEFNAHDDNIEIEFIILDVDKQN